MNDSKSKQGTECTLHKERDLLRKMITFCDYLGEILWGEIVVYIGTCL